MRYGGIPLVSSSSQAIYNGADTTSFLGIGNALKLESDSTVFKYLYIQ
jgi:hypothetical protein